MKLVICRPAQRAVFLRLLPYENPGARDAPQRTRGCQCTVRQGLDAAAALPDEEAKKPGISGVDAIDTLKDLERSLVNRIRAADTGITLHPAAKCPGDESKEFEAPLIKRDPC
jgi:hypothetical protein